MAKKSCSILGTSITQFGELWDLSLSELFAQAVKEALTDAQLEASAIDAVYVANKAAGSFENQCHLNAMVSQLFPHFPPTTRIEAACASGGVALMAAEDALQSGRVKTVLVVGAEKMTDVSAEEATRILSGAADVTSEYGSTFPALYALLANAFGQKYGLKREVLAEMLAAVAVKNHQHALQNPKAQFHKALTVKDVLASPVIAPPLHTLDCSPLSDGAAALILTTDPALTPRAKAQIIGRGHAQDTLTLADRQDLTHFAATQRAAAAAFAEAQLTPQDIDAAEVHDCFTIAEIFAIADLGFFTPEQAANAALTGNSTYDGQVIINPSGGLKACGHPVGATGVKQVAYLAQQLAQHKFQTALAHNVGGAGATAVVHILQTPTHKGHHD